MKNNQHSIDFTQGSIPRHLINFTIPLFLGNLLQTFYNTVDTIWVGKFVGPQALAAVSVSFPIIFILISLATGITMATTVLVGQYKGAGDDEMVKKVINNTVILLVIASAVMTTVGIVLHKPILKLMNTPDEIMQAAAGYLNIIFAGLIFTFGYNGISAVLRGLGDSNTPLLFLFYTTIINIILDPILIFGIGPAPKMGVSGAALATVISQAISVFLAIRHLNRMSNIFTIKFKDIKYDSYLTKQIIKIGLPAGMQQTVVALGATVVMSIVNTFGETIIASFGAAKKIDSFSFMPSMSIGLATSSLTAQNIGAGKFERVKEVARWSAIMAITISVIVTAVVISFPKALLSMFTSDPDILREGAVILRILAIYYVPFALMWVFSGIIRGAGDTLITMLISILSLWGIRLPLALYLSKYTTLGSKGIWIAMVISTNITLIMNIIYFVKGRWRRSLAEQKSDDNTRFSQQELWKEYRLKLVKEGGDND
ncbi:MAG: MATE family efflux transporter [Tepidanaerobacteraceae bacterium]